MAKKKHYTDNGSLCSGYGVYPDGRKCKGCSDCEGNAPKTMRGLLKVFNRNHAVIVITKKTNILKELKKGILKTKSHDNRRSKTSTKKR